MVRAVRVDAVRRSAGMLHKAESNMVMTAIASTLRSRQMQHFLCAKGCVLLIEVSRVVGIVQISSLGIALDFKRSRLQVDMKFETHASCRQLVDRNRLGFRRSRQLVDGKFEIQGE